MLGPKPARSRHCKWGVSPDPVMGATGSPEGAPGKAGPRRRSTSQETWLRSRLPTPFEAKGVVDATASQMAGSPGPDRAPGGARAGAEERGSGGGDGDRGADPDAAARGLDQRGQRGGFPDLSLPDRGRGAPQRAGGRDPAIGLLWQDLEHLDPRGQRQSGAGHGGRRAGQELHARAGRPVRPLPGPDRPHRDHPGRPVDPLRRRRHRRRCEHHHSQGERGPLPGHRAAGGGQLRHVRLGRPRSAAPTRSSTMRCRAPTSRATASSRTTARTPTRSTPGSGWTRCPGTARSPSSSAGTRTTSACP